MGQVTQLAKTFYDTPLEIELLSEEESMDMTHVVSQNRSLYFYSWKAINGIYLWM